MLRRKTPVIHPFILSGGSGTRLWPLSRKSFPKQFLNLVGEDSLLLQTCHRLKGENFADLSILANEGHRFLVAEQMREAGIKPASIVLEPEGRNTAPAALIAALMTYERDPHGLMLLLPSDHVIDNNEVFQETLLKGVESAQNGYLVTYGIKPTRPETGYGYIETVKSDENDDVSKVKRFVEKPNESRAKSYLKSGHFFWNAGIFLFSARTLIEAFQTLEPELLETCQQALDRAEKDLDFCRLDKEAYHRCKDISLDYAIMERSDNIACVALDTAWNDLGAWDAVWDISDKDKQGNVIHGDVITQEVSNSFLFSEEGKNLSLVGVSDVIAVATRDAVLVAAKDKAQDVKKIVDQLKQEGRLEATEHKRMYRPWGWYEELSRGERFQVKALMVKPGAQLSLQSHYHRAEHWVVVSGTAEVTLDCETRLYTENESVFIPIGTRHRLGNKGKLPALLIEVQSGSYLGEDDIERYADDFGREGECN